MDVVLLFPGQGSQKPGMARDLADASPEAQRVFELVDHALGVSLSSLAFHGPDDQLTATQNAQPALLAHGAAVWAMTKERLARSEERRVGKECRAARDHAYDKDMKKTRRRGAVGKD